MSKNDSYIRWQSISIKQLGFTTNLIFTITVVLIGFSFTTVINPNFVLTCGEKSFFTTGFIILILCFISGIVINLTRLFDYRLTARTARKREKNQDNNEIQELRARTKNLSKASWIIFYIQLISFGLGSLLIIFSLIHHYSDKLF